MAEPTPRGGLLPPLFGFQQFRETVDAEARSLFLGAHQWRTAAVGAELHREVAHSVTSSA